MAEPTPKRPPLCPHGYRMWSNPEDAKVMACVHCQDELDMLLERLRWGEK